MRAATTQRWVRGIGWSCVAFGVFLVGIGGLSLVVLRLVPEAFDAATPMLGPQLPLMAWIRAHWAGYALAQVALGAAHLVIGLGLARLRPWARLAFEALCWLLLLVTIASGWTLFSGTSGSKGGAADTGGAVLTVLSALLLAAQLAGLAVLIVFLRRKGTGAVFAGAARVGALAREDEKP